MNPEAFVSQVREHYLEQFKSFAERQKLKCAQGSVEVKLKLGNESEFYRQLYCADFISNDGGPEVIELQPAPTLEFNAIEGSFGEAELIIKHLRWDDIVVYHDACEDLAALEEWFQEWFDPEDERPVESGSLGNVIHSLLAQPGTLSVDLGSAEPEAFWELLNLLNAAGATKMRVTASTVEEN